MPVDPMNLPRAGRPEVVAGTTVGGWMDHRTTAQALEVTTRTLERWEEKGFPAHGTGRRKAHPWPHAIAWALAFRIRERHGEAVRMLDCELALLEYKKAVREEELELQGRAAGVRRRR